MRFVVYNSERVVLGAKPSTLIAPRTADLLGVLYEVDVEVFKDKVQDHPGNVISGYEKL